MLKTVNAIEKTEKVADVAMKTVALGTAASVAYDVVDITRSTVTHGLTDTAMAVIR